MYEVFANWDKPFLTAFGDGDPVTTGGDTGWQETVPDVKDQPQTKMSDGHPFIQEDNPAELVELLVECMRQT